MRYCSTCNHHRPDKDFQRKSRLWSICNKCSIASKKYRDFRAANTLPHSTSVTGPLATAPMSSGHNTSSKPQVQLEFVHMTAADFQGYQKTSRPKQEQKHPRAELLWSTAFAGRFGHQDYWREAHQLPHIIDVPFPDPWWPRSLRMYPRFGYRFDSPHPEDYPPWVRVNFVQMQNLFLWRQAVQAGPVAENKALWEEEPLPPWFGKEVWDPTGLHSDYSVPAKDFPPHLWEAKEKELAPLLKKVLARRREILEGKYGSLHVEGDEKNHGNEGDAIEETEDAMEV